MQFRPCKPKIKALAIIFYRGRTGSHSQHVGGTGGGGVALECKGGRSGMSSVI